MKQKVFYSFHFDNDVFRVQQIRNMGVIEGNPIVEPNTWESIKRSGDKAIKQWINTSIEKQECVIVLVGSETSNRKYVKYEIERAYNNQKPIFGIFIHNLVCLRTKRTCLKGQNPFTQFNVGNKNLSEIIPCYDPPQVNTYNFIQNNLINWINKAKHDRA